MHKLRKPRPGETATSGTAMSRTMQLAVSGMKASTTTQSGETSLKVSADLQRRGTWFSAPLAAAPRTTVEQYWAARALVAETLLSVRDRHQNELAEIRQEAERKREREIGTVLHANDQRQQRLERVMVMCLAVLLGFMCWLVMMITPDRDAKGKTSRPSHFTIPILSPFASVVEHETGVFGTKAVVIFVVVVVIAMYVGLRQRFMYRTAGV